MKIFEPVNNERGVALFLVMVIAFAVGTLSVATALVSHNASLINRYNDRQNMLVSAADAAIEEMRSRLNLDGIAYLDAQR